MGHHLEAVIQAHGIRYIREATTEKRNGPDFLFPGETEYHSEQYDASRLTMLAAKTSCKDRWRQVLAEADRIANKHLLTLQPGISLSQTEEMEKENLQLVVPEDIRGSFTPAQRKWLINLKEFLRLVSDRE